MTDLNYSPPVEQLNVGSNFVNAANAGQQSAIQMYQAQAQKHQNDLQNATSLMALYKPAIQEAARTGGQKAVDQMMGRINATPAYQQAFQTLGIDPSNIKIEVDQDKLPISKYQTTITPELRDRLTKQGINIPADAQKGWIVTNPLGQVSFESIDPLAEKKALSDINQNNAQANLYNSQANKVINSVKNGKGSNLSSWGLNDKQLKTATDLAYKIRGQSRDPDTKAYSLTEDQAMLKAMKMLRYPIPKDAEPAIDSTLFKKTGQNFNGMPVYAYIGPDKVDQGKKVVFNSDGEPRDVSDKFKPPEKKSGLLKKVATYINNNASILR